MIVVSRLIGGWAGCGILHCLVIMAYISTGIAEDTAKITKIRSQPHQGYTRDQGFGLIRAMGLLWLWLNCLDVSIMQFCSIVCPSEFVLSCVEFSILTILAYSCSVFTLPRSAKPWVGRGSCEPRRELHDIGTLEFIYDWKRIERFSRCCIAVIGDENNQHCVWTCGVVAKDYAVSLYCWERWCAGVWDRVKLKQ